MAGGVVACGRKGPPLPPLIRLPEAPTDVTATRRGGRVDIRFTVPVANTDGTRPANLERVDVYGFTGPASVSDDLFVKNGARVGSVAVKAPRDPDAAVEPEFAVEDEPEPPEGPGLDQGAIAHTQEVLTAASLVPADDTTAKTRSSALRSRGKVASIPLPGTPWATLTRTYASIGVSKNGRRGPLSKRVAVPLVEPPEGPSAPKATYSESAISLRWSPPLVAAHPEGSASGDVVPARILGVEEPTWAFNVYEVTPGKDETGKQSDRGASLTETRLTGTPVAVAEYDDNRVVWGVERCYVVRTVKTIGGLSVESDASPPTCVTPVDTFPLAAPQGLMAVAAEGSISLIWQPNGEKDLAGYIVSRGIAPAARLEPMMSAPVPETTFRDLVQPGVHFVYAVQAVDKAGNMSPMSNRVEETAR
jgi:hypothetical protein